MNAVKKIDQYLNAVTMYRAVLYGLALVSAVAVALGAAGVLNYSGGQLLGSVALSVFGCVAANKALSWWFGAAANPESSIVSGLILFLIISPPSHMVEAGVLIGISVLAMASKYGFAFQGRHIFNPAAFAAVALGLAGSPLVSWWVGSRPLLPWVLIVGALIVRKVRRAAMVGYFIVTTAAAMMVIGAGTGLSLLAALEQALFSWPIIFLGSIMLTEPHTTPPTRQKQAWYGIVVGALFVIPWSYRGLFATPELALVMGNIFSFLVSQKRRITLRLATRENIADGIVELKFFPDRPLRFLPGQYMEWTLPHKHPDSRGIRRFFTIASAPTEKEVRLGVRMNKVSSSFKQALQNVVIGGSLTACNIAGDFTLPRDPRKKLAFIAGGIGITPFRSMIKYLLDRGEKRDIILFHACATPEGFVYQEVFNEAAAAMDFKLVCLVTDAQHAGAEFLGRTGYLDHKAITEEAPDWNERRWYLSGPPAMVDAYRRLLRSCGVKRSHMVTDYFPGL